MAPARDAPKKMFLTINPSIMASQKLVNVTILNSRLDRAGKSKYNKRTVSVGQPSCNVDIWSYAMEIREPCQVGNKAALSGTFHVP